MNKSKKSEHIEKITFDSGIKTYQVNESGILKFNPSDPNVYQRFNSLKSSIQQFEKEISYRSKSVKSGEEIVDLLREYDKKMKDQLSFVFGEWNDFDQIFSGVNVMAVSASGELIITNFLNGIRPIIEEGIRAYAKMEAQKAIQETKEWKGEK